jgi:hypothetical protein
MQGWRIVVLFGLAALGCGSAPPETPSAVIQADPPWLCEGDAFRTPITLDASSSTAKLSLVPVPPNPDEPPLAFRWTLVGARHRVLEGDFESEVLRVVTEGDRPLHVELWVMNADGGEATTMLSVGITLAGTDPACGGGT